MTRLGSLFTGIGGLDLAVAQALGDPVQHEFVCEVDDAPSRVLQHRFPGVPNLGDITAIDWSTVGPVDVLCGGFPCPDVSVAGRRAGLVEGTRSGLWTHFARAIDALHPSIVIIENVRGLLSATAIRDMGTRQRGVDQPARLTLRAMGAVLGDLAALGFDAQWGLLSAAAVGAPHRKRPRTQPRHRTPPDHLKLLPTPRASDGEKGGPHQRGSSGDLTLSSAVHLLPTPTASRAGRNRSQSDGATIRPTLDAIAKLLPTPTARLGTAGGSQPAHKRAGHSIGLDDLVEHPINWGDYTPRIRLWEDTIGQPAPAPTTVTRTGGKPRLAPEFVAWMMGLPAGWIDTPVLPLRRSQQLKALGNAVVPQQAYSALTALLARAEPAARAA